MSFYVILLISYMLYHKKLSNTTDGTSKLMSEWILRESDRAQGLRYAALRYFNVTGASPQGRVG
jgi:UDP-glucose 4-epimerase